MVKKLTRDGRRVMMGVRVSEDVALELDRARGARTRSDCLAEALEMWLAARKRWSRAGVESRLAGRRERPGHDEAAGVTPLRGPGVNGNGSAGEDHVTEGWVPAFPGQRPPFRPGNQASRTHGAKIRDDGTGGDELEALAADIRHELLSDPEMPAHLRSPAFGRAVARASRLEAAAEMLFAYVARLPQEEWTVPRKAGTKAPMDIYFTGEMKAGNAWARIGLDPVSYAGLVKSLGLADRAAEAALDNLAGQGAQITAARGELEAGYGDEPGEEDPAY